MRAESLDWVTVKAIKKGLADPLVKDIFEMDLAHPRHFDFECVPSAPMHWAHDFSDYDFEQRLADSSLIAIGRVTSIIPGVLYDAIGSLIEIQTTGVAFQSGPPQRFWVFAPQAEFRYGGRKYCFVDPDVPVVAMGDELLVSVDSGAWVSSGEEKVYLEITPFQFAVLDDGSGKKSAPVARSRFLKNRPYFANSAAMKDWLQEEFGLLP